MTPDLGYATIYWAVSGESKGDVETVQLHRSRAAMAKICTKKRDARANLFVCLIKLLLF